MTDKAERLQKLQEEYLALQQEIAAETKDSPEAMRDTLYGLLYAAIVRHGVATADGLAVIQVLNVQPDPNHRINWYYSEDRKSLFISINEAEEKKGITVENNAIADEEAKKAMEEVMS